MEEGGRRREGKGRDGKRGMEIEIGGERMEEREGRRGGERGVR